MILDWVSMIALLCVIVACLIGLGAWLFDLVRVTDDEYESWRYRQQLRINSCIAAMIASEDENNELEWTLHSLLYEYRNHLPVMKDPLIWSDGVAL